MSTPLEIRMSPAFGLEVKASGQGVIEGIASVFNGPADAYGDIIAPGAFQKSLDRHKSEKSSPLMLWSHDPSKPVGRWDRMTETRDGLEVRGHLNLNTSDGKDAWEHVKAGDISGLSIGFTVPSGGGTHSGRTRNISEIELHEVSLVAMPAQRFARITETRSIQTRAQLRDLLRANGLPRRAAEKLCNGGWPELLGQSLEELQVRELAASMREIAARLRT